MNKSFVTSFIAITIITGSAHSASSVRAIGTSAGVPVAAPTAARAGTRLSTTGAVGISGAKPLAAAPSVKPVNLGKSGVSGANARLSSTQFLAGKGQSLGGGVTPKDLSDYATLAQLDSAESRLDGRIDVLESDTYTKSQIDSIISAIELTPGPEGAQGTQGAEGAQGFQGAQGPQGVTGESAYELAVRQGFIGTEEEWLTSISFPTADEDGLYVIKVTSGQTDLKPVGIVTGEYTGI
ncbi:MAG: hypothetical protein FWE50_00070 [Alphaproteobacteria bacterium]|nr:hypothetical protein [Alphaproteobacteria bacterium]